MIKKHGGNVYQFAIDNHIKLKDVIDFSANINPFGMSDRIENALPDMLKESLNYPDPDYRELYHSISAFENIDEEMIVVGNGAIECIFLIAESLKAKKVLIQAPTFVEYERAFSRYGSHIEYYPLKEGVFFDLDSYLEVMTSDLDCLVICNPNNPTGQLLSKQTLIKVMEKALAMSITVIIDEAFIDFTDDETMYSIKDQLMKFENLIILKSLTKFFAIPGLRLGYFLTSNQRIIHKVKSNRMPWAINTFAASCGVISMNDQGYINKTKSWIISERIWFYNQLNAFPQLVVYKSQGNYIFFKTEEKALDKKLSKYGIMIRNCSNYHNLTQGCYRVAIKSREHNMKLVECLGEIYGNH